MEKQDNGSKVIDALEANIKNKEAFYELLVRNKYVLPAYDSKFVTAQMLIDIRDGKVFCLKESEVYFAQCFSPPTKQILVDLFNKYIQDMGLRPSGINSAKKNFPDKRYLVTVVASLSRGQDPIFTLDYVPKPSERKVKGVQFTVDNSDGLFSNIPSHLVNKQPGRGFKFQTVTKADKLQAHMIIAQERMNKQQAVFAKRQKELDDHKSGKDKAQREQEQREEDIKQKLFNEMKVQAEAYIQEQIQQKDLEMQQKFSSILALEMEKLSQQPSGLGQIEMEDLSEPLGLAVDPTGIQSNIQRSQQRRRNQANMIRNGSDSDLSLMGSFSQMGLQK